MLFPFNGGKAGLCEEEKGRFHKVEKVMDVQLTILTVIFMVPSLIIAFTVHEYMHAFVAFHCGDPTAKYEKRLSLNPLVHIEPFWAVITVVSMVMLGFCFGRGRPVPVNENYLKNPRWDGLAVTLAGPLSNFAMALLGGLPIKLELLGIDSLPGLFLLTFVKVNTGLGLFNLLPIPSLDGWKVLLAFLPDNVSNSLRNYERRYPMAVNLLLYAVIFLPFTNKLLIFFGGKLLNWFTGLNFGSRL